MPERLVVIGGDAGGMAAASEVRRRQPATQIVALERGTRTSYSACGIPYLVGGEVDGPDRLVARTPEEFRDRLRIDVRMRHEATGIDLDGRTVEVHDHERGRTYLLGFDRLHLGTGARPIRPDLPGIDGATVHGVQTVDDGVHLLEHARRIRCERVVVVGGGYIGIEMAEAFVRWGAKATLIDANEQPMRTLDPDLGARVAEAMRRSGIDVRLGVRAQAFTDHGVETDVGSLPADLVVLGLGVAPNSELAADAGIDTGTRGAVRVDRRQETSAGGVYAAGDCAESFHRVTEQATHVALGTVANKQGRVAGINLGGGYARFPGVVGTAISRFCGLEVARTGLQSAEIERGGFEAAAVTFESTTAAGYMPEAAPMTVRMYGERGSRRLLGCQIIGGAGAAKRIDVAATAITARLTVDDVIDLDLAYAPPFSGVWDPIAVGARKLQRALG